MARQTAKILLPPALLVAALLAIAFYIPTLDFGDSTRLFPREIVSLYLPNEFDGFSGVALSPDGRFVAVGVNDASPSFRLIDTGTGTAVREFPDTGDWMIDPIFSSDGRVLATIGSGRTVRVWDTNTGEQLYRLELEQYPNSIAFSPDEKEILTAGIGNHASVWDIETGREVIRLSIPYKPNAWGGHDIHSASYSPDGQYIVTASADNIAYVWDATDGSLLFELAGHETTGLEISDRSGIYDAEFSPDGASIITAGFDGSVRIWDASTGNGIDEIRVLDNPNVPIYNAIYHPQGGMLAIAPHDSSIYLWDTSTGKLIRRLSAVSGGTWITSIAFSADGRFMAASGGQYLKVWSVNLINP